jgi:uncharacterized repeat protein (TIGR01451 family)
VSEHQPLSAVGHKAEEVLPEWFDHSREPRPDLAAAAGLTLSRPRTVAELQRRPAQAAANKSTAAPEILPAWLDVSPETVEAYNLTNVARAYWPCGNREQDATITNPVRSTASINSDQPPTQTSVVTTPVVRIVDPIFTKGVDPGLARPGEQVDYFIMIENPSPPSNANATNVTEVANPPPDDQESGDAQFQQRLAQRG